MANNDDSLFREIQGELEREKYEKLWSQYGVYIIAGVVAFIASVAGYQYWSASSRAYIEQAGARYESALALAGNEARSEKEAAEAMSSFEALAKDAPGGYRALAQLQLAGMQVEAGKKDVALKKFEGLAKDTSVDPILRDFAGLQAATLRVGDADWTEMENRLNALMGDADPWRYSAMQLLGVAAFKAGKLEKAREVFNKLSTRSEVPTSIRERASLYMSRIVASELVSEGGDGTTSVLKPAEAGAGDTAKSSDGESVPNSAGKNSGP